MRINDKPGFTETRESLLLRAIIFYDHLNELSAEGIIRIESVPPSNLNTICNTLTSLAVREAYKLNEIIQFELISDLETEPVTQAELRELISRPLSEYLSFKME